MLTNKRKNFQNTISVETGLSDHHKMTVSVFQCLVFQNILQHLSNTEITKTLKENFRNELPYKLLALNDVKFEDFETIFMNILNKHAPMKEKLIRVNNSPFMNKTMAIMTRSEVNKINKQELSCKPSTKNKNNYYANLDINNITDDKKFWSTVN